MAETADRASTLEFGVNLMDYLLPLSLLLAGVALLGLAFLISMKESDEEG